MIFIKRPECRRSTDLFICEPFGERTVFFAAATLRGRSFYFEFIGWLRSGCVYFHFTVTVSRAW